MKTMKKTLLLLLAILMLACAMAACGSTSDDPSNPDASDALDVDTSWEYIQGNGKLIIGLDDTFAPMGFRDESGELVGFDIDLAKAVGEVLGIQIEFQPISWNAKEMMLSSKRIDCVWNGMSATAERQEQMALTSQYLNNIIRVASLDASINVKSAAELASLKIGIQSDSAALEMVMAHADYDSFKANITEYPTYDEAILDMQAGRVDVIIVDQVLADYKNTKMSTPMTFSDFKFGDDFYAIGCRKGDKALAAKISEAIGTLIDNGKAAEISEKWFGNNIVILKGYED